MKKLLTLSLLVLLCASGFAQQVVLVFTGQDATTNRYVQLSRIEITDLTQGWTETLYYPDTMAILTVGTGIAENAANGVFGLSQNNPNPFNGTTDVNLTVADPGEVAMEITDANGRLIVAQNTAIANPGTHRFRVNVAATGIYFLTARQNGKTSSVKMVNNGNGTGNGIEYAGTVVGTQNFASQQTKNGTKGAINHAFAYGDAMTYRGFAEKYGMEIEGQIKAQTQILSETITLLIDYSTVPNPNDGSPCTGAPTLTDVDGNTYNTVQIGSQCWMKENLKTTKYADGTPIENGSVISYDVAYWYYPNNEEANKATYGLLYNWKATMGDAVSTTANPSGVQGICPTGWHVPSDAEWTQLTDYVSSQSAYCCSGDTDNIAKALASTTGWDSSSTTCAVGNTPSSNNATGFSALPAGYYDGIYNCFGNPAIFWSATETSSDYAYYHGLDYDLADVFRYDCDAGYGYSVRCVRDESFAPDSAALPTVTTNFVSNITEATATCGGNVAADGGATTVTARGVCWSTSQNPTVSGSHTTDGTGTGSFTSSITGLSAGTTYYVRAYATNSAGTAYGEQRSFTTSAGGNPNDGQPCPGTPTLTDVDGNTYNTVLIGEQCWMKENLRTTKYADSTPIALGTTYSYDVAYRYAPDNNSSNVVTYGYLYNWKAVMRNSSSNSSNPSGVQGICPTGWHVPSDAEWTQLTDYVRSQSAYCCSGYTSNIAKALASQTGWFSYSDTCCVGDTPSSNNATGFSALPAGCNIGGYTTFGSYAYFWSATENSSDRAYDRGLSYNFAGVGRANEYKTSRCSVRCVRD